MEEDESKNAAAAAEQSQGAQPVESIKTPDTPSGAPVEGPGDQKPADGEGCEAVTVVIICLDPDKGALAARSVRKNLVGVDADIHVVSEENLRDTLPATLLEHLPHCQTERIVLMTDGMLLLNPVTLSDIGVVKCVQRGSIRDYDVRVPIMLHKSALEPLLQQLVSEKPYANVANEYFLAVMPEVRPIDITLWLESPWLLPLVSVSPDIAVVGKWAETQKFLFVSDKSWSADVVKFLEERFPE